jgi:hypothetical protein
MKKWAGMGMAIVMLFGLMSSVSRAAVKPDVYVNVVQDGYKIWFPDAQAFLGENGRTMVPIRFVAEKMEADVTWEPNTQTALIHKGNQEIQLTIGEGAALVNKEPVPLDTSTILKEERTFVPLRFVSEVLGAEVSWNEASATAFIQSVVTDPSKLDPWGRLIRTTDLPTNAADYPYILADVPNEIYEMKYPHSHPDVTQRATSAELYANWPEFKKENVTIWMERLRTFGTLWLNVDYRTIDDSWAIQLAEMESDGNTGKLKAAQEYVAWVKENEIVIKGFLDPEPSMIYLDGLRGYNVRSKFRIKFDHFKEHKNLILDTWFPSDMKLENDTWVPNDTPFEKGIWYEGYADILLDTNVGGNWGKLLKVSPNASLFFNHTMRKVE